MAVLLLSLAVAPPAVPGVPAAVPEPPGETRADSGAGSASPKPWALVLSGGGARGLAHVGVLKALDEQGLRPDAIVGTSMGAVLGSLYASGYSAAEIEALVGAVDWERLVEPSNDAFLWRGGTVPRPVVSLDLSRRGLQWPTAAVDDAALNHVLADLLLGADAAAGGDFDRLPVRFRAVTADLSTADRVVMDGGSLARAVRASMAIPLVYAPVRDRGRLLTDGGVASNLPVSTARDLGYGRFLAVDVGKALRSTDELSSGLDILSNLFRLFFERSSSDTVGRGDLLVRLRLPGYSSVDFFRHDSLVDAGYRIAAPLVARWADSLGIPRRGRIASAPDPEFAPLDGPIAWKGLGSYPEHAVREAFAPLPEGAFRVSALRGPLLNAYRTGIFNGVWPNLRRDGDTSRLELLVDPAPRTDVVFASAWGTDEKHRFYGRVASRPAFPLAPLLDLTAIARKFGASATATIESHALSRGGSGAFAIAGWREEDTRLFRDADHTATVTTRRWEGAVGGQLDLSPVGSAVAGAGVTWVGAGDYGEARPLLVARFERRGPIAVGANVEGVGGDAGYHRARVVSSVRLRGFGIEVRPRFLAAWVGDGAPPDALPAIGGPSTLAGLQEGEWRGRRAFAGEVRVSRGLGVIVAFETALQAGLVTDAVSAPELPERPRFAGVMGVALRTPVGPVRVDAGMTEGGRRRVDLMLGARF